MNQWPDSIVHNVATDPPPRQVPIQLYDTKLDCWQVAILPPEMMAVDQHGNMVDANPLPKQYIAWSYLIEVEGNVV